LLGIQCAYFDPNMLWEVKDLSFVSKYLLISYNVFGFTLCQLSSLTPTCFRHNCHTDVRAWTTASIFCCVRLFLCNHSYGIASQGNIRLHSQTSSSTTSTKVSSNRGYRCRCAPEPVANPRNVCHLFTFNPLPINMP